MTRSTIALSMIVKDAEATLARCLDSVQGLVQHIVIVDTGSTDQTVEIAKRYTQDVRFFEWCDDFSAARNAGLNGITCDWVLILDADEWLAEESHSVLAHLLSHPDLQDACIITGLVGPPHEAKVLKRCLFRTEHQISFAGRVHEYLCGATKQVDCHALHILHESSNTHHKWAYYLRLIAEELKQNQTPLPRIAELQFHAGKAHWYLGDYEAAHTSWLKAWQFKSTQPWEQQTLYLGMRLLSSWIHQQNYAEGLLLSQTLLKQAGLRTEIWAHQCLCALGLEQLEPAVFALQEAHRCFGQQVDFIESQPLDIGEYLAILRCRCSFYAGNYPPAIQLLETLYLNRPSKRLAFWLSYGYLLNRQTELVSKWQILWSGGEKGPTSSWEHSFVHSQTLPFEKQKILLNNSSA